MTLQIIDEVIALAPIIEKLGKQIGRHSRELSGQLRRAWPRVMCNACEAMNRMGAKRTNRFDDAMGESKEAHGILRYAIACEFCDVPLAVRTLDRVDKVTATLFKLAHRANR